jgi:hypothetical protein
MIELPLHCANFIFFYFTDGMLAMASMPNGNLTSLTIVFFIFEYDATSLVENNRKTESLKNAQSQET